MWKSIMKSLHIFHSTTKLNRWKYTIRTAVAGNMEQRHWDHMFVNWNPDLTLRVLSFGFGNITHQLYGLRSSLLMALRFRVLMLKVCYLVAEWKAHWDENENGQNLTIRPMHWLKSPLGHRFSFCWDENDYREETGRGQGRLRSMDLSVMGDRKGNKSLALITTYVFYF